MVAEAKPTCANTRKPLAAKKARMIKQGMAATQKEIETKKTKLFTWAEIFPGHKETDMVAVMAATDRSTANTARTDALLSAQDDTMLLRDTTRIHGWTQPGWLHLTPASFP